MTAVAAARKHLIIVMLMFSQALQFSTHAEGMFSYVPLYTIDLFKAGNITVVLFFFKVSCSHGVDYALSRGVTVHKTDGSVRTSVLTLGFGPAGGQN